MFNVCLLHSIHLVLSSSLFFHTMELPFYLFTHQSFFSSLEFKLHENKALSLVFTVTFSAPGTFG